MFATNIEWLGNPLMNWIGALVAALVIFLALPALRGLALSFARRQAYNDRISFWDGAARCLSRTYFHVVFIVAIYVASAMLVLPHQVDQALSIFVTIGIFVQIVIWLIALVDLFLEDYDRRTLATDGGRSTAIGLIAFFAKTALISIVFLVALDQLGINITALVAGLGVGGIAIALAAQTILGDLFASLTIVLDKPFEVGDFLIVGELLGTVERVGLKTTRLRSLSGEQLVFSNNDLLQSRIKNFKRMQQRRVVFNVGVLYETPFDKVKQIPAMLREVVESQENVQFDRAHLMKFGAYALEYEIVYHVLLADYNAYADIQEAINFGIFQRFQEMGVEFAYPTQKLFIDAGNNAEQINEHEAFTRSPQ